MMAFLAKVYGNGPALLREVAEGEEISEKYLSQIVIPLRGAGLLKSARGAHGGYLLGRAPEAITVREIVEVLEGGFDLIDPDEARGPTAQTTHRVVVSIWKALSDEIARTLESVTLADIVKRARERGELPTMYNI